MSGVLALAAIAIAAVLFVRSWVATGARLDRDIPTLTDPARWCADNGHHYVSEVDGSKTCRTCGNRGARHGLR
jgi:hypothetical protein